MADREVVERLAAALVPNTAGGLERTETAREQLLALSTGDAGWRVRAAVILLQAGAPNAARELARQFVLGMSRPDHAARDHVAALARICIGLGDHAPLERYVRVCYGADIAITAGKSGHDDCGLVRWMLAGGKLAFDFASGIDQYRYLGSIANNWAAELPVLVAYATSDAAIAGAVWLNLEDFGRRPGLTFSDYRPDYGLVPDPIFMMTDAYRDMRATLDAAAPSWEDRRPIAYWRGASTGWVGCNGITAPSWRELPRAVLCRIARHGPAAQHFDVGISQIAQMDEPAACELRDSGLMKSFEPLTRLMQYRFQIDIDGNTNAWMSLFLKLCSGSPVLKVQSGIGFRQWYYDRLKPWWNFVPIKADMSDLHDVVTWLLANQDAAHDIGARGRCLAASMTVAGEIAAAFPTIAAGLVQDSYLSQAGPGS